MFVTAVQHKVDGVRMVFLVVVAISATQLAKHVKLAQHKVDGVRMGFPAVPVSLATALAIPAAESTGVPSNLAMYLIA